MGDAFRGRLGLAALAAAFALSACRSGNGTPDGSFDAQVASPADSADRPVILFEVSQENHAWSYQLSGTAIDDRGVVVRYRHGPAPWKPASDSSFTVLELWEKFGTVERVRSVPPDSLEAMRRLIPAAAEGSLSPDADTGCRDFGTRQYIAYRYDPAARRYIPVLLYQAGDRARWNRSEHAKELAAWLFTLTGGTPPCAPGDR